MTAPINDNFADAILLWVGGTRNGNSDNATNETGETNASGFPQKTVWYKWVAPSTFNGVITFTATFSFGDLIVYEGNGVTDTLTSITNFMSVYTTGPGPSGTGSNTGHFIGGNTYYFQIGDEGGFFGGTFDTGDFYFTYPAGAIPGGTGANIVPHGAMTANLSSITGIVLAASASGHASIAAYLSGPAVFNATVDGTSSVTAALFNPAPPNDDFANAETMILDVTHAGTLVGSTIESNEFNGFDPVYGAGTGASLRGSFFHSVWYAVTAVADGTLGVSFSGTDSFYVVVYGSTGGVDTQDTIVMSTLDGYAAGDAPHSLPFSAISGTTYYLQVMWSTDSADFTLMVQRAAITPWTSEEIDGTSSMTAGVVQENALSATISGHATSTSTLSRNSSYATIQGHASVPIAVLSEDGNPFVAPYFGDPTVGAGGTVTTATGPYPNIYHNYTAVAVQETIGPAGTDSKLIQAYVSLFATDRHSADTEIDYIASPLSVGGTSILYSCERWIRLRFQAPFDVVDGLRMWMATDPATYQPGWSVKYGVTDIYTPPVSSGSGVATTTIPTSDPGAVSRSLMDSGPVTGLTDDYLSKWVVIQAGLDPTLAGPGPIRGFSAEGVVPFPLLLQFAWVEF